ncbi:MAG: hypothetical protein P1V97_35180, partial [Planctomycetota bacterium]|nr:hypothetical protein [Planctomycetota bacterium]
MEQSRTITNHSKPRCPYCHDPITADSLKAACYACMAWHHEECWQDHGKCSSCHFEAPANRSGGSLNRPEAVSPPCLSSECHVP